MTDRQRGRAGTTSPQKPIPSDGCERDHLARYERRDWEINPFRSLETPSNTRQFEEDHGVFGSPPSSTYPGPASGDPMAFPASISQMLQIRSANRIIRRINQGIGNVHETIRKERSNTQIHNARWPVRTSGGQPPWGGTSQSQIISQPVEHTEYKG